MTWQFAVTGLGVGILVGMTGMGGGSLMTPILILLFGFDPRVAVGTDILHGAISKSFGAARHRMLGTVHARLTGWMFLGSGPLSLLGVLVAHRIGDSGAIKSGEGKAVGAALVLGGIGYFAKTFIKRGVQPSDAPFLLTRRDRAIAVALGATCGFVVGLTSVGSGTFFGLTMLLVFPLTAQKIVGTDIFHAAALLWVAGLGHLAAGDVNLHAMAWLLVGSVPGILIGSQWSVGIPDRLLRVAFSVVLTLSGIKLLDVPGGSWVLLVGLAVGAICLAGYGARTLILGRAPRPQPERA